jgi:hypothetical protein
MVLHGLKQYLSQYNSRDDDSDSDLMPLPRHEVTCLISEEGSSPALSAQLQVKTDVQLQFSLHELSAADSLSHSVGN